MLKRSTSTSSSSSSGTAVTAAGGACERLQRALCECHRRIPGSFGRDTACRRLNQALAQCLVSEACPDESEAVRSMCGSGGTALKRSQCQQAQLSLSVCISSHQ